MRIDLGGRAGGPRTELWVSSWGHQERRPIMLAVVEGGQEASVGVVGGGVVGTGVSNVASRPSPSDLGSSPPQSDDPQARIQALEAEIARLKATVAQLQQSLAGTDRRRQIEKALTDNQAVDLETAMVLTEAAMSGPGAPDAATAVRDLRKRKPFLFHSSSARGSAMSGAVSEGDGEMGRAADEARASGDRAALLRYLKMRRGS